jgi:hypothetical protein
MSHRLGDFPTVEMIDERGRPYTQYYGSDDIRAKVPNEDSRARWQIVEGLRKRVPSTDEIQVVAQEMPPNVPPDVTHSMGWRGLRVECSRLLDEPNARPRG